MTQWLMRTTLDLSSKCSGPMRGGAGLAGGCQVVAGTQDMCPQVPPHPGLCRLQEGACFHSKGK